MTFLSIVLWACFPYISSGTYTNQTAERQQELLASLLLSCSFPSVRDRRCLAALDVRRSDDAEMVVERSGKKKKRRKKGVPKLSEKPAGFSKQPTANTREIGLGTQSKQEPAASKMEVEPDAQEIDQYGDRDNVLEDLRDQNTRMVDDRTQPPSTMDALSKVASSTNARAGTSKKNDQSSPPGCEAVFELASLDTLRSLRVGTLDSPPSFDEVLSALLAVDGKQMNVFVQANRDLLDHRFLFRLTAGKLLAQNTGDTKSAAALQGALKRVISYCIAFDRPLYANVAEAEKRAASLISSGKIPSAKEVQNVVGDGPQGVFAFWFVLKSAITSWEAKVGNPKFANLASQQLRNLYPIESVLEKDDALMERGGIAPLQKLFALPNLGYQYDDKALGNTNSRTSIDNEKVRKVFDELTTDSEQRLLLLRRLGCLSIQADRHNSDNYKGFVTRSAALYDVLFRGSVQLMETIDIKPKPREKGSVFSDDLGVGPEDMEAIIRSVWGDDFLEKR